MLKDEDVLAVQARLIALGFHRGEPDELYGPKTVAGVAAFGHAVGL